jgi:hypothetical protein
MTAIENLYALKLKLEHQLKTHSSGEEREWIEGELVKIDIALGFLEKESASQHSVSR